jgi:hypothetical protein
LYFDASLWTWCYLESTSTRRKKNKELASSKQVLGHNYNNRGSNIVKETFDKSTLVILKKKQILIIKKSLVIFNIAMDYIESKNIYKLIILK